MPYLYHRLARAGSTPLLGVVTRALRLRCVGAAACLRVHAMSTSVTLDASPSASLTVPFQNGRYNSVEIDGAEIAADVDTARLAAWLKERCDAWRAEGRGSVWFAVTLRQTNAFAAAAAAGFHFHHAEGQRAMLHIWLQEHTRASPVPPYASHNVGVGGVVVDDDDNLLLVREPGRAVGWKFPGGLSNASEDIGDTAVREVMEETGVRTRFRSVLAFRQQHGMAFGLSDIFVLCRLALTDARDRTVRIDANEIEEATWMPASRFLQEVSHPLNHFAARIAVLEARAERGVEHESLPPLPRRVFAPQAACIASADERTAWSAGARVGAALACERVFIPATNRHVKVYHSARAFVYDHEVHEVHDAPAANVAPR